ncbi:type I restriction-modification system, S subunit [Aquipseudomonas alcaligenes]|nr:type I restriction-modification system, S subunit [Pseudomonas alcaligenes]
MTRPNLNAVALINEQHNDCIASTGFDVLQPCGVEPRWIFAAVRSAKFVNTMCDKVQGALYPAVKSADIRAYEIPLPPLAEQTRIAQKLDELLAQVDTLKARIDAIPALLKRFRQSVLAAAVSGRLTEEWRTQHVGWVDEGRATTAPASSSLPVGWSSKTAGDICGFITKGTTPSKEKMTAGLRIPRHSDTQPTLIRTPVPRSFGQAVGAQRRRGGIVSLRCPASSISASVCALIHPSD